MKRILIFSLTYHPYVGGAEVAIKEITDRLSPAEFVFDMVTLRFDSALPEVERIGNITVHRIGPTVPDAKVSDRNMPFVLRRAKLLFPFGAFWKARALHKAHPYDMTWGMMANQAGFAALFFKYWFPRVPYFLELQDGRALSEMTKRRRILLPIWWLYKRIYLNADRIKGVSHFIEREVRAIGYTKEIDVIPNAVDVAKFSQFVPLVELAKLKEKYEKKLGDVFLFTASRLVLSRGVEDTIRALSYLPYHVKLLIAGTGDDQKQLEAIADEIGVTDRVIFAGHIDHAQLPLYYKISDIFVRPSIIEGFGNVFVEAFAAGIPVVATPVGGIPDFLFDPDHNPDKEPTGLFCAVRDPKSIAEAVKRYMNDPVLTANIITNAKQLAAEKYDWNIIARDVRTLFSALV
ncbi:MAG: 1,2-diacylglycerol 3-glucosyltransferase [Candidatus Kaiserbacteria bacterium]|nr:1,2-diacylglycerol 3-glucosyltransferase [Candidatus Kaiserbacteria bacterium]